MLVLFFLYIHGPVFNSISPIIDFTFIISIALVLFNITITPFKKPLYCVFLLLIVVSVYSVISLSFFSGVSLNSFLQTALSPIRVIVTLLGGWVLIKICYQKGMSNQRIISYVFIVTCLHGLIMIGQLIFPEFKEAIYAYTTNLYEVGYEQYSYEYHFRMGGVAGGFGSAALSISMAFPLLLMPQLHRYSSGLNNFFLYLGCIIIIGALLISGRSGLLVLFFFLPISIFLNSSAKSFLHGWVHLLIFLFLMFAVAVILLIIFSYVELGSDLYYSLSRTLETLINFEKGNYEDKTVNTLYRYILFPNELATWVVGNGEHLFNTQSGRALDSDIGVIRNIWGLGLFVAVLYWFPYLYLLFVSMKRIRLELGINLFLICAVTMFFQLKEDLLYSRILCSYLGIFLAMFYFYIHKDTKVNYRGKLDE